MATLTRVGRIWIVTAAGMLACAGAALGQYQPPADYYTTASGTGALLRGQLRTILGRNYWSPGSTIHQVRSYDSARQSLVLLAPDPTNPTRVILIYSGVSVPGAWDAGVTWNREHTWPDSRGLAGSGPDYTDLHQLRPCNPSVNSSRGNDPFGIGGSYWDPQPSTNSFFTGSGSGAFVAGTNDRGEMARAMMYMDVRYDGTDASTVDLVLVNGFPGANQMGDLARLLAWHYEDPVNDTERRRNHLIFSNADNPSYFQGNRNPFVDRPEFVWALWGTSPNDSTLFVGAAPSVDGSSSQAVNFRVIQGTSDARAVTLTKSGSTPTTFDVLASGPFTVTGTGSGRAFVAGPGTDTLWITPLDVTTLGSSSGQIVVNNTDLTSAGPGLGVADANDLVTINAAVLSPSNPSYDGLSDVNSAGTSITYDANIGTVSHQVLLFNFGYSAQQARMDVDSFSNLPARFGASAIPASGLELLPTFLTFSFDTNGAAPGLYPASIVINTSDEDIPGQTTSQVVFTWNVTIAPPHCAGDADGNGTVNFADITSVLTNFGAFGDAGDADGNGTVNFADITSVLTNFGSTCP